MHNIQKKDRRAYFSAYHKARPKDIKCAIVRKYFYKKRRETLEFLGNKCIKCGFSDWRALQIDHINGCGIKNRLDRYALLVDVKKHSEKYQLLCSNCNWIKKYESKNEIGGRPRII